VEIDSIEYQSHIEGCPVHLKIWRNGRAEIRGGLKSDDVYFLDSQPDVLRIFSVLWNHSPQTAGVARLIAAAKAAARKAFGPDWGKEI
jgi:hypothetical protein